MSEDAVQLLGNLDPQELAQLIDCKRQENELLIRIGLLRVQEYRLMGSLRQIEQSNQQILHAAGRRLGIPDGTAWSVTEDGKAYSVRPLKSEE